MTIPIWLLVLIGVVLLCLFGALISIIYVLNKAALAVVGAFLRK